MPKIYSIVKKMLFLLTIHQNCFISDRVYYRFFKAIFSAFGEEIAAIFNNMALVFSC
jgi:hypothetical protein